MKANGTLEAGEVLLEESEGLIGPERIVAVFAEDGFLHMDRWDKPYKDWLGPQEVLSLSPTGVNDLKKFLAEKK